MRRPAVEAGFISVNAAESTEVLDSKGNAVSTSPHDGGDLVHVRAARSFLELIDSGAETVEVVGTTVNLLAGKQTALSSVYDEIGLFCCSRG